PGPRPRRRHAVRDRAAARPADPALPHDQGAAGVHVPPRHGPGRRPARGPGQTGAAAAVRAAARPALIRVSCRPREPGTAGDPAISVDFGRLPCHYGAPSPTEPPEPT